MRVFGSDSVNIKVWGPTASVTVNVEALGGVVGDSWLLTDFHVGAKEIVDVRQCFNDVSYIYALGNNQAKCELSLTFAIFIGRKNCLQVNNNTSAIDDGIGAYVKNRISNSTETSKITIGDFSSYGWLIGFDIGQVDAVKGICYASVQFIMKLV